MVSFFKLLISLNTSKVRKLDLMAGTVRFFLAFSMSSTTLEQGRRLLIFFRSDSLLNAVWSAAKSSLSV
jgi:hypothetical protein